MHILGKVLVWLTVLLIAGASWLSIKTLSVRHRWLSSVESRQTTIQKQIRDLEETRDKIRKLEDHRQNLVNTWGDVWVAPNSRPQPGGQGAIELGVGSSANLPQRSADGMEPSVYVFANKDGASEYLGEFAVLDSRATQSIVRMTRPPFANETDNWPQGNFHVRRILPANWLTTAAELQGHQIVSDSRISELNVQVASLLTMVKASEIILAQRLQELNGNAAAPIDAASEVKEGLVKAITTTESERNTALVQLDGLRREVILAYDQTIKLLTENQGLLGKLAEKENRPSGSTAPSTTLTAPRTL